VVVEAVEYPVGEYPPSYAPFSVWSDVLTLLVDATPLAAQDVCVYYGKLHSLDASTSTIPARLEDVVATGRRPTLPGWASFAEPSQRRRAGVWRQYLVWGQERLATFARELARHGRRAGVRVRRLYRFAGPADLRATRWEA
jgi:hypothetical protein